MGILDSVILAEMNMAYAGIVGLMFVVLIVFAVLAAKTWHWVNIVFLILSFMAGIGAIMGLTTVYKLRTDAMIELRDATEDALRMEAARDLAILGNPASPVYDPGSLRQVSESLAQTMAGRGRVWSGGQVAVDGENRMFTFSTPRPVGNEVASLQDVVLFAFLESDSYPVRYIGSVRVTAESPQDVKIESVALADSQEFNQPTGTWSLFEKMPQDRRGTFKRAIVSYVDSQADASEEDLAFAENLRENLNGKDSELDITRFRQVLVENYLPAAQIGFDPDSEAYESLIDQYAFDGLSIGKINLWIEENPTGRNRLRFEPIPEEVFVLYQFESDSDTPVAVDSIGKLETDGIFSPLGLAVVAELKMGHPINFKKGDTVLIDQPSANGYQSGGELVAPFSKNHDVTKIDEIFIRQVRDFPYEFGDLRIQSAQVVDETELITKRIVVQTAALADAQSQVTARVTLIADSDSDQTNLKNDFETVQALVDKMTQEVAAYRQTISSLETKIDEAYLQLRKLTIRLSREAFAQR